MLYWKLVLFALIAATLLVRLSTNKLADHLSRARGLVAHALAIGPDSAEAHLAAGQLDQRPFLEVRVSQDVAGVVDRRGHHLEAVQDGQHLVPGPGRHPGHDLLLQRVVVGHPGRGNSDGRRGAIRNGG